MIVRGGVGNGLGEIGIEALDGRFRSILLLTDAPFLSSCVESGDLGGRTMSEIPAAEKLLWISQL
jgi:hypothetical protein